MNIAREQRPTKRDQRTERVETGFSFDTNPFDIDNLPKIPGQVYKWVTVDVIGKAEMKGYQKALMERWRPVTLDSLRQAGESTGVDTSFLMAREINGQAGIVGSHDMVLMMRPVETHNAQMAQIRQNINSQEKAVDNKFNGALPSGIKRIQDSKVPIIDD
jgi:hypothetical protein